MLKKYWLFILLAMIATLLTVVKFSSQPQTNPVNQLPALPKVSIPQTIGQKVKNIKITLSNAPSETSANLLTFQKKQPLSESEITQIAQNLGFKTIPIISTDVLQGKIYSWTENSASLTVIPSINRISFGSSTLNTLSTSGQFPDTSQAEKQLLSLAQKVGVNIAENNLTQNTKFISINKAGFPVPSSSDKATIMELDLSLNYNGFGVVDNDPTMSIIGGQFDRQGKINSLFINDRIISITSTANYPLKNSDEIKKSLPTEGNIIAFSSSDTFKTENYQLNNQFSNIDISNIKLVYYLSDKDNTLQPTFLLSGEGTTTDSQKSSIQIYLPAIKDEYLSSPLPVTTPGF